MDDLTRKRIDHLRLYAAWEKEHRPDPRQHILDWAADHIEELEKRVTRLPHAAKSAPDEREIAARALEDAAQAAKKEADETSSPDNALALSYCIGFCRSRAERLRAEKEGE